MAVMAQSAYSGSNKNDEEKFNIYKEHLFLHVMNQHGRAVVLADPSGKICNVAAVAEKLPLHLICCAQVVNASSAKISKNVLECSQLD
jgi:hypothetical protein